MEFRQMGLTYQLLGIGMGSLLCDLLAFPTFLACHGRINELRRPYHGSHHLHCVRRLVYSWT